MAVQNIISIPAAEQMDRTEDVYVKQDVNFVRVPWNIFIGAVLGSQTTVTIDNDEAALSILQAVSALNTYIGKMVRYDDEQTLTEDQKIQARTNIGAENIPTVSASDNGKVLKVVEGEWNAAEEKNYGITYVSEAEVRATGATSVKEWTILEDPNNAGQYLVANGSYRVEFNGEVHPVYIGGNTLRYVSTGNNNKQFFTVQAPGNDPVTNTMLMRPNQGKIYGYRANGTLVPISLPIVSSTDAGKLLQVSAAGEWDAVAIENAAGGVY